MSHIPTVDLTDAARFYGMASTPKVVEADPYEELQSIVMGGDPEAAWDTQLDVIIVWPDVFDAPQDYDQGRFAAQGVGPLDAKGKAQFIIAHELWHAAQDEKYGADAMQRAAEKANFSIEAHDSSFIEQDADKHAAQAYKLVKIGE